MIAPTFTDWPQESIDRLTGIIRQVLREELNRTPNHDAAYLASLTKEEYDRHIAKEWRK